MTNYETQQSSNRSKIINMFGGKHLYLPEANPTSNRPTIIMVTFWAPAMIDQPMALGRAASLRAWSLPIESIMNPPVMAPSGTMMTITLAVIKVK